VLIQGQDLHPPDAQADPPGRHGADHHRLQQELEGVLLPRSPWRMPILAGGVRSRITSMMFNVPMPPTISDMIAAAASRMVTACSVTWPWC